MSIFKRKPAPEPAAEEVAPFDGWTITTELSNGATHSLVGTVFRSKHDPPFEEMLRYVDAIADGLRGAGFPAVVTLERKQVTER